MQPRQSGSSMLAELQLLMRHIHNVLAAHAPWNKRSAAPVEVTSAHTAAASTAALALQHDSCREQVPCELALLVGAVRHAAASSHEERSEVHEHGVQATAPLKWPARPPPPALCAALPLRWQQISSAGYAVPMPRCGSCCGSVSAAQQCDLIAWLLLWAVVLRRPPASLAGGLCVLWGKVHAAEAHARAARNRATDLV